MKRSKPSRGFTLIELLVVVGIIAILIAILLPSLAKSKETARRVLCGTNLKAQGSMLQTYASQEKNGALPYFTQGSWLHDEAPNFTDVLLGHSTNIAADTSNTQSQSEGSLTSRRLFYCPSSATYTDPTHAWEDPGATAASWTSNPNQVGNYRALGYEYWNSRFYTPAMWTVYSTGPAPGATSAPPQQQQNTWGRQDPLLDYRPSVYANQSSSCEVVADAIITAPGSPTALPSSASAIDFSYSTANLGTDYITEQTSHLNGKLPAGANELYLDGHVDFKKFSWVGTQGAVIVEMAGSTTAPLFWFPNP